VISGATSARTYRNRDIADRNGIMRTMVVRKLMGGCVDSHERNLKDKGVRFAFVSSFDLARACASPDCCTCFRDHANVQNHDWWDERANLMREPLFPILQTSRCSPSYHSSLSNLLISGSPLLVLESCSSQPETRIQQH
jgi:hypothetical protein